MKFFTWEATVGRFGKHLIVMHTHRPACKTVQRLAVLYAHAGMSLINLKWYMDQKKKKEKIHSMWVSMCVCVLFLFFFFNWIYGNAMLCRHTHTHTHTLIDHRHEISPTMYSIIYGCIVILFRLFALAARTHTHICTYEINIIQSRYATMPVYKYSHIHTYRLNTSRGIIWSINLEL